MNDQPNTLYDEAPDFRYLEERRGSLLELPPELRPRERLIAQGVHALSNRELLAVVLNTGIPGKDVSLIARDLLKVLESSLRIPPVEELARVPGLGNGKAARVAAMLEYGRRHWGPRGKFISGPEEIHRLIRHHADPQRERFITVSLNGAHEVLAVRVVTTGLMNRTIVHPREVFADLIGDRACAACVAHNHPSGQMKPSGEDDLITERLEEAARILGISFVDHLIFSEDSFYSYRRAGKLRSS